MIKQSSLAPGEDYPSASELLAADDLPQVTLRVWGKPIRVRGLSLEERERIRATTWRSDGQRDTTALVVAYLQAGIVAPALNEEQAKQFAKKHASSVEQVYLFIDRLTELDYDLVVAQAQAVAGLAPGQEQDSAGGSDGAGSGSVD